MRKRYTEPTDIDYKVYISHAEGDKDKKTAALIAEGLRKNNVNCATTSEEIHVIPECSIMVIIVSEHTRTCNVVNEEVKIAQDNKLYIIGFWVTDLVRNNFNINKNILWHKGIDSVVKQVKKKLRSKLFRDYLPYIGVVSAFVALCGLSVAIYVNFFREPKPPIPSPTPTPTQIQSPTPTPKSTRFVDNGDQTITDKSTRLVWTKNAKLTGYKTWQEALDYVASMNKGTVENFGYTDWRLPTIKELYSLCRTDGSTAGLDAILSSSDGAYCNGEIAPLLTGAGFTIVQSYVYWSSSSYARHTSYAWVVGMVDGSVLAGDKSNSYYVWPVRSGH